MEYYLKFNNETEFKQTFLALNLATIYQDQFTPTITTDVIGTIYKPTGAMLTSNGIDYPEMLPIVGWHVNIIADLTVEQQAALPLIPKPITPYRVWAGTQ